MTTFRSANIQGSQHQKRRIRKPTRRGKTVIEVDLRGSTRDAAGAPRRQYLVTTVTKKEKDAILRHCHRYRKSVSAFLADLALDDARRPANKAADDHIPVTLRLRARDFDKMCLFARLEEKTVEELLKEFLEPSFRRRQTATTLRMHTLRCWLSDEEHRIIKAHLAKHRLSARSYLALLALKAIEND
jgi:hypothetical protein